MESSKEGRLGLKRKSDFQWKGKTFSQISSVLRKNTRANTLETKLFFRPLPAKLYRREIASIKEPNNATKQYNIQSLMDTPGGNIINSSTVNCNGSETIVHFNYEGSKTARPCNACDYSLTASTPEQQNSNFIQTLSQQESAKRRVRSSGMVRTKYENKKANNYQSAQQYLQSRNKTFKQNQFNNLRIGDSNALPGSTASTQNVYASNTIQHCEDSENKTNYVPVYYKPNNSKFATQGAVDSGDRLLRLKYDTITKSGNTMREAYGDKTANALAYGVPVNGYTIKDKIGYPNKCTPVFPKKCYNE